MAIEVNYDGMGALQRACGEQVGTFGEMKTFFTTNCGSAKFSSIPVLALFSPVYSDAADTVERGLGEAKDAADRSRDTVRRNKKQYRDDDIAASTRLVGTYTKSEAFNAPASSLPDSSAVPYNGDVRNGATWGSWATDGSMGRLWPRIDPLAEIPGPKYIGGRGGSADVLGVYYDGLDMINASSTAGAGMDDNRDYDAFENGASIDGNTPTFADHKAGAINLFDARSALQPVAGMDTGPLIEGLKSELGGFIGGLNWVLSKLGYDLMGKLLEPVAGSFRDADKVRGNLDVLGGCSRAVGVNYAEIAAGVKTSWVAPSATKATNAFTKTSKACERQGDGLSLMSRQVGNFITATYEGVKLVVSIIGTIVDEVVGVPVAKLLGWIIKGASKIKKWIKLIKRAIELIDKLKDIVPPLLAAARALSRMALAFETLMRGVAVGAHAGAGNNIDNTAEAVY